MLKKDNNNYFHKLKKIRNRILLKLIPSIILQLYIRPQDLGFRVSLLRINVVKRDRFFFRKENINHKIRKLKKLRLDLSQLPRMFVVDFFAILNNKKIDTDKKLSALVEDSKNICGSYLYPVGWLGLYQLCCIRGLFNLGYQFRKKALEETIRLKAINESYIAAQIEKKDLTEYELDLLLSRVKNLPEERKEIFQLFHSMISLEKIRSTKQIDLSYKSYLKGMDIALVGPSVSEVPHADQIDKYDGVVRINYLFEGKGCDSKYKGKKTNITYFNLGQTKVLINQYRKLPESIGYTSFKKNDAVKKLLDSFHGNSKVREIIPYSTCLFNGSLNMIPLISLDLLAHDPKLVMIFHTDLMLSLRRFNGYHPPIDKKSNCELKLIFNNASIEHDPATQYFVLNRLWKKGKILGDERFNEVMKMGCDEFMHDLQHMYMNK